MTSHRRTMPLDRGRVRFCLGVLWLLDAGLQAQPHLFGAAWWHDDLAQSVMAESTGVSRSILWAVSIVTAHAAFWNSLFVVIELGFGIALLSGKLERAAIIASIPYALGVWWVGEGFGMLPTGFALLAGGSPGPVVFYLLLGLLAWPGRQSSGVPVGASVPRAAGSAVWLALWAGQALQHLPWVYPPGQVLFANVEEHSLNQLGWQLDLAHHVEGLIHAHPIVVTVALATVEVAIGATIALRRTRRASLLAGITLSLVFWVAVQYFGGILGGGATDPGSAPLLVLLALALWPRDPATDRSEQ